MILKTGLLAGIAGMMLAASPAAAQGRSDAAPRSGTPIANQWICTFDGGQVQRSQVPERANAAAQVAQGRVFHVYRNTIKGFAIRASQQGVTNMIQRNPWIRSCRQDRVITLAPPPGKGPGGGGDTSGGQSTPWGIARVGGPGNTPSATAWVIDSGIDLDHPDLNVDVGRSKDFTGSRSGPEDENGHGTHVAGTIAAIDNNYGVVGVAPGAKVVAVRVLDRRGSGSYAGVIAGVDYVKEFGKPGDVANMSLGGPPDPDLDAAVIAASATVKMVLAAGNDGEDAAGHSPARADGQNVYTISAIDQSGRLTSWSNYGLDVDYAEPGAAIESTWKSGGYNTISGTSMAAPHAAGILLLGSIRSDGTASGDRDSRPDPIGVR